MEKRLSACRRFLLAAALGCLATCPARVLARSYTISPSTTGGDEEFERLANKLEPGDELVLRGGVYSQTGRRAITCKGRPDAPIVIRAADGETPVLTRPEATKHRYRHNNIEIVDSEHLVLRGIHFRRGSSGVRFIRGRHITLEGCEVSETGNNAITLNSGDTDSFVIRTNHIHHTGLLDPSIGETEGEGMYIGCNRAQCIASNHVIEGNYIHDLRATSSGGNDGIELKYGSHGNTVRHNVIHDTTSGKRYPGIFAYGVRDPSTEKPNIIEGNLLWSCGEAIYVVADAIVRNNIVLHSDVGITSYRHAQVPHVRNVTIVHNTVVGTRGAGLRLRWNGAEDMLLAGNAVFNSGTAVDAAGLDGDSIVVRRNVVGGALRGASFDSDGFVDGGSIQDAFVSVGARGSTFDIDAWNLWPSADSPLRGAVDPEHAPELDFNGTKRRPPVDAGAYQTRPEHGTTNPGWRLQKGSKELPDAERSDS